MAQAVLLRRATVLTPSGWAASCDVLAASGRIAAVGPDLEAAAAEVIDAEALRVAAGFIDVHVHGAGGAMFEDGRDDSVERICAVWPQFGTTAILATIAALPPDRLRAAVVAVARVAPRCGGARVLGVHLEGPFLNPRRAGAQRADWMRLPALDEIDALQSASGGLIRLVTLAPELPGTIEIIGALRARGIAVALGHSEAGEDDMLRAVAAGATHVTHLFNAAAPFHHRAPGLIGTALTDDRLSVELICDGIHLHRRAVDIALRCKPEDKLVLVSDGVAAVGMADGDLVLFGVPCVARGAVRIKTSGQLAGSTLTLDRALRTLHDWFPGVPLARLLACTSAAPAALLGLGGEFGAVVPGGAADLVALDADLGVAATLCRGGIAYRR